MKRLNRLLWLGLLAVLGLAGQSAQAQRLSPMTIGTSIQGATFFVDGQRYVSTQTFTWAENTMHVVQFPFSADENGMLDVQYLTNASRFRFGSWVPTYTGQAPADFSGDVVAFVATPNLTSLIADVTLEYLVSFKFQQSFTSNYCQDFITSDQPDYTIDLFGVMFYDGTCLNHNVDYWLVPGVHEFRATNYPGFVFKGIMIDGLLRPMPMLFTMEIKQATEITFVWEPAKRMRFTTYPSGLDLNVDGNLVTPQFYNFSLYSPLNSGGECMRFHKLPIGTTLYVAPLCVGEFDYQVGTTHTVGAPALQRDKDAKYWVFDHFSNGSTNPGPFVVPDDTSTVTTIQGVFVKGIPVNVISNVPGLKVAVDGDTSWTGVVYGGIWGAGHKHTVSAPPSVRDAQGRSYRFVSWSDGGAREHDITLPDSSDGLALKITWELLGQIQVVSSPTGLALKVNGSTCTTPCTFDQPAGTALTAEASQNIPFSDDSRFVFTKWDPSGSSSLTQSLKFTGDVQIVTAIYRGSRSIMAASDPTGAAKFTYDPPTADGFYADGTAVRVTVEANSGYRFVKWNGDLTSRSRTETLVVRGTMKIVAQMESTSAAAPLSVRNAAGAATETGVAPGSIIAVYSQDLADQLKIGPTNPLAQAINSTSVTVDDTYILPLMFVSPTQINAQMASSISNGQHTLAVRTTGKADRATTFNIVRNAPGLFFTVAQSGMPLLSAVHEDGSPITEASPARRGETVSFYGTGFGGYNLPPIDGFPLTSTITYKLIDPVKILVGVPQVGSDATGDSAPKDAADAAASVVPVQKDPVSAIGATGMVGTSQIKLKLDTDMPAGAVLEISVTSNGVASNKAQLPIK